MGSDSTELVPEHVNIGNLKTLKNKLKPFPKLNLDLWDTKEIKLKLKNKSRSSIGFKFLQKDDLF
ncbi:uncharacterized protein T551_00753 [Pneumocystis jirovecii RU7]|uniref:Uncharacterized protein n=1 Tax=Pneumocystis jirovecii (strain RU7) TaxID=1408657 RepID=A0A0W4ZUM0_PNEJ7|nr:uncharacterized protein T551_00753 [Pneumocystis jirovecii RU7]KTW32071.1 hypothetical protein T551_00753 [Pneumocystis jirovecii RU7]